MMPSCRERQINDFLMWSMCRKFQVLKLKESCGRLDWEGLARMLLLLWSRPHFTPSRATLPEEHSDW